MELVRLILPALACLLSITGVTSSEADPCAGCRYENGVGYLADPSDCRNFFQCVDYGVRHSTKTCAAGTYWSQDDLACTTERTTCASDIPYETSTDTGAWVAKCDGTTRAVSGYPSKYEQKIPGWSTWLVRDCPPGTVYELTNCACETGGSTSTSCSAELYIPFTGDTSDKSGRNVHVENDGVRSVGGHGIFADNTGLTVNRFSNAHLGPPLSISAKLRPAGNMTTRGRAIVSNTRCEEAGSVFIINKGSSLEFRVLNMTKDAHVLSVSYTPEVDKFNNVSLKVSDGTMRATVDGNTASTAFTGTILNVQCALHIGQGTGYDNYLGLLDDFSLNFCKA